MTANAPQARGNIILVLGAAETTATIEDKEAKIFLALTSTMMGETTTFGMLNQMASLVAIRNKCQLKGTGLPISSSSALGKSAPFVHTSLNISCSLTSVVK